MRFFSPFPPRRIPLPGMRVSGLALAVAIAVAFAAVAAAEEPATPSVPGLDQLLKLPSTLDYGVERRGGATRSEWRARFAEARARLFEAETTLRLAQDELAQLGGESEGWTVGPAGLGAGGGSDAPLSFELRQQIKRADSELILAQSRLRELEVEANLAGVPSEWRISSTESQLADDVVVPLGEDR